MISAFIKYFKDSPREKIKLFNIISKKWMKTIGSQTFGSVGERNL